MRSIYAVYVTFIKMTLYLEIFKIDQKHII